MPNNLKLSCFDLQFDSSAQRPALKYTIILECPACAKRNIIKSPLFSVLERVTNTRDSKFHGRLFYTYKVTIRGKKETQVWVVRENFRFDILNYCERTQQCTECGVFYGFSGEAKREFRNDANALVAKDVEDLIHKHEESLAERNFHPYK